MSLKFFGRGGAFSDEHNSAFFVADNELVMIDCPASAFQKAKKMDIMGFDNIFILVTHTHGDHAGGIGMMLQYVWFMSGMKKHVTVVAPSDEVKNDLKTLLDRIEGCEPGWYELTTADRLKRDWLVQTVPTTHSETLAGRCFGYRLCIGGINTVYTGDSSTLEPFLPLLEKGSLLYTETAFFKSGVHMYIGDILPTLRQLVSDGVKVFLMHLDDEESIQGLINGTGIELAPLL